MPRCLDASLPAVGDGGEVAKRHLVRCGASGAGTIAATAAVFDAHGIEESAVYGYTDPRSE